MTIQIIGFSGKRESGKTTTAKHLVENHGYERVSFAYELRMELLALGYPHEVLWSKPTHPVIRDLMIAHGRARRMLDPAYWLDKLFDTISTLAKGGVEKIAVDDLRYHNEAVSLKSAGATLVRVVIDDPMYRQSFVAGVDDDESETGLDMYGEWDAVFTAGKGDLVELYRQADDLVEATK